MTVSADRRLRTRPPVCVESRKKCGEDLQEYCLFLWCCSDEGISSAGRRGGGEEGEEGEEEEEEGGEERK